MRWAVVVIAAAVMCAVFPPVRIVRSGAGSAVATMQPAGALGAAEFWDQRLLKSLDEAVDVAELLPAIRTDAKAASEKHGRRVGLSDTYFYFVRGIGKVVSKDAGGVAIALPGEQETAVLIKTGLVFGNDLRDGTGLLDVNAYGGNSQTFNALSEGLNRIVEERVLPTAREKAAVGKEVHFAGVAAVEDESTDLRPLKIVPIEVEVR